MKPILYLLQGQANQVQKYLHLRDRPNSEALFLTYDVPLKGAEFLPQSTFSEGRNVLYHLARQLKNRFEYYIFCDDDIEFMKGDWDLFEDELLHHRPGIAVPVVPRTRSRVLPGLRIQVPVANDEQLLAIHSGVFFQGLLFPHQSQFDNLNWWAACRIQEVLIQHCYICVILQFNRIEIGNTMHHRYPEGNADYQETIHPWLRQQLRRSRVEMLDGRCRCMVASLWHTCLWLMRGKSTELKEKAVLQALKPGSVLSQQMINHKPLR